jgi:hypothetical protein
MSLAIGEPGEALRRQRSCLTLAAWDERRSATSRVQETDVAWIVRVLLDEWLEGEKAIDTLRHEDGTILAEGRNLTGATGLETMADDARHIGHRPPNCSCGVQYDAARKLGP